jgi:hypothetical protein
MLEITELVDIETLKKLMGVLNINSFEELKKNYTCKKIKELLDKKSEEELSEKFSTLDESTWMDSIEEAIKQEKSKDSAAFITQTYGPETGETENNFLLMKISPKDQEETIRSLSNTYLDITGKSIDIKRYETEEQFLAAEENKDLPEEIKKQLSGGGFPATIYTLKFTSQQYESFKEKIQNLIDEKKITVLDEKENLSASNFSQSSTGTLNAHASAQPFKRIPEPTSTTQPSPSASTDPNQNLNEQSKKNSTVAGSTQSSNVPSPRLP